MALTPVPSRSIALNARRSWIALIYGLATLLAQSLHDHGERTPEPPAVGLAGCDDPRPHFAGHGAPEIRLGDLHCPACQFRADHQSGTSRSLPAPTVVARRSPLGTLPIGVVSLLSRPTQRGPPFA